MKRGLLLSVALLMAACDRSAATDEGPAPADVPPPVTDIADLMPDDLAQEPAKAAVHLRIQKSYPRPDGVYPHTRASTIDNHDLALGETRDFTVGVDCGSSTAGGAVPADGPPPSTSRMADVWTAAITRQSAEIGKVRLSVQWRRWTHDEADEVVLAMEETRELILPEGTAHVLDMRPDVSGQPECGRGVYIDIFTDVVEDERLASRELSYDLWVEHRDGEGNRTLRRFLSTGAHGEQVDFDVSSIGLDVPGRDASIDLDIEGSLRGRFRDDGTVAIEVTAERTVQLRVGDVPPSGSLGRRGSEVFALRPGQTIRMDLPALSGTFSRSDFELDLAEAFAQHEVALIVTVTDADAT